MATAICLAFIGVIVYLAVETVIEYRAAQGTVWERLQAAFKGSSTIAFTRLNAFSVLTIDAVAYIVDFLGASGLKDAIAPYLGPNWMLAYILFVVLGAEVARRRTLKSAA